MQPSTSDGHLPAGAFGAPVKPSVCITVLAHNEAGRIAVCLNSLPLGCGDTVIHVVINGSTDGTEAIARRIAEKNDNVIVHVLAQGGKARSWNAFIFDILPEFHDHHIFVDGDAEVLPRSIASMAAMLNGPDKPNAVSAMPANGRKAKYYRDVMRFGHMLFGDLYGLSGAFLTRMKESAVRLPADLIGDDGLICALAKTDLGSEDDWEKERVAVCEEAGFLCKPFNPADPVSWHLQYRRMISYSMRHYQNRMISEIMQGPGPRALPDKMSSIYKAELGKYQPRKKLTQYWFDREALKRMAREVG